MVTASVLTIVSLGTYVAAQIQAAGSAFTHAFATQQALGVLLTFHYVCLAWIFFRAPTFGLAFDVLGRLFVGWSDTPLAELCSARAGVVLALLGHLDGGS